MKKLLHALGYIFVFLLCVQSVSAQTYLLSPGNKVTIKQTVNSLSGGKINIKNLTADSIVLTYVKVSNDWTGSYMGELCDNGLCYPYLPEKGTYRPMGPVGSWDQWAYMTVRAGFGQPPGTYKIRYAIWDVKNPSHKDTLTFCFEISAEPKLGVDEAGDKGSFIIAPNPVKDVLTITTVDANAGYEAEITDMKGAIISRFVNPDVVNVAGLSAGIYFIKVLTANTVSMQKFVKE